MKKNGVVDFNSVREKKITEKMRKAERILFKNTFSLYSILGNSGLCAVDIEDVSEEGLAFSVMLDELSEAPKENEELKLRLYFSRETFLPLTVKVMNTHLFIHDGLKSIRVGCLLDTELPSTAAYKAFVTFLREYTLHAHKEHGDKTQFYL